ncbi:MAG: alpha/beta hydrolase [Pseudomonadota bacterium]
MSEIEIEYLASKSGNRLGFKKREGKSPTLVWLCGFHSDMAGQKATAMDEFARENGLASLRFDYSGTGTSDGKFEDGTISKWLSESQEMIDVNTNGDLILVGSSMGAWLAILLAMANCERVKALVLIAPAPALTEDLMWVTFSDGVKAEIMEQGYWMRPSPYDAVGYPITKALIEDGRNNSILNKSIDYDGIVHILHGCKDADVPWQRSPNLMENLNSNNVTLTLIKSGDHRLSEPQDLETLRQVLRQTVRTIL